MMMRVAARIAALWCAAAVALQRPAPRARPQRSALRAAHVCAPGDYVKVDWSIACTSGKPIPADELMFDQGEVAFQVGAGNYLPALHGQLLSSELAVGETATLDVAARRFGLRTRLGPLAVPAAQAPRGMKAGDLAGLENGMMARATFAGGCFWGVELAFQREPGVAATAVGYAMGDVPNPTYEAVCSGATGHTEAVRVMYDPALVSFERLCDLFWDRLGENRYAPNQVGNDRGTQYRHGIYYRDAAQRDVALKTFDVESARFPERKIKKGQSAKKNDEATIRCYG
ncbi:peptide-methionine (S)-S-oxide reductase [Aureococcus anophagefferens]|nr:peptide-methionine (S)-S-oxide reductase [Aureococcus anophagefferens]